MGKSDQPALKDIVEILLLVKELSRQEIQRIDLLRRIAEVMNPYVPTLAKPIFLRRDSPYEPLTRIYSPDEYGEMYKEKGIKLFSFRPSLGTTEERPGGHEIWLLSSGRFLTVKTTDFSYDEGLEGIDGTVYRNPSIRWRGEANETLVLPEEIPSDPLSMGEAVWRIRYATCQIVGALEIDESQAVVFGQILEQWSNALLEETPQKLAYYKDQFFRKEIEELLPNLSFPLISENAQKALRYLLLSKNYLTMTKPSFDVLKKLCEERPDLLIQSLEDENHAIRYGAISLLGETFGKTDEKTLEALIHALKSKYSDIRAQAAWLLGEFADRNIVKMAVEPLIQRIEDEDANVRSFSAQALGKIGVEKAVEPLIKALKDNDEGVRGQAVIALNKIGPNEEALIPLLQMQTAPLKWPPGASKSLEEALKKLRGKLTEKSVEPTLQFCLRQLQPRQALQRSVAIEYAVSLLNSIGGEKGAQALVQIYERSKKVRDQYVQKLVGSILDEIGKRPKSWGERLFG